MIKQCAVFLAATGLRGLYLGLSVLICPVSMQARYRVALNRTLFWFRAAVDYSWQFVSNSW